MFAKCLLNYVAFVLLSVTYASPVLCGYRLTICFGISTFNLCRSLTCFAVLFSLGDIIACHFPFVSLAMSYQQLHMLVCRRVYICIHFCYTLGNHDYFLRNTYLSGKNVVAIFSVWSRSHFQHKMYKHMNITRKN